MMLGGMLRDRLAREDFQPSFLSAILRPVFIIRRGLFNAIREFAPAIKGDVLDFGCGSKPYESLFREARSYIGVDLETAGHDHRDSKVDVFYNGKVLPFADGQFDAVVSFEVFEHVFNLREVLAEIHRVTSDSGHLLLSIPFAWEEHEIPFDFARYTSFGISHLLDEAGYEVVQLKKTTTYTLAVFQMLIAWIVCGKFRFKLLNYSRQLFLVFPLNLLGLALNAVVAKRNEFYCNIIVLAKKVRPSA
jgi:SAM-dependent methyltransferase